MFILSLLLGLLVRLLVPVGVPVAVGEGSRRSNEDSSGRDRSEELVECDHVKLLKWQICRSSKSTSGRATVSRVTMWENQKISVNPRNFPSLLGGGWARATTNFCARLALSPG